MNLEKHKLLLEWIRHNRFLRRKLGSMSHSMFFAIYFPGHMAYKSAPFQKEIFRLTEMKHLLMCVISSFRGSAKSTICSMSWPIWMMITGQAHYIILASQTQKQSRQQLQNIRIEFETNTLLRNDWGPFETESDQWGAYALTFKHYDSKIQAVSIEEAIRGYRYKQYRPQAIVLDDIENLDATRTRESRDKVYSWFTSEIVPLGTLKTRILILGNFLHDLSLVGRLIAQMKNGTRDGEWRRFPLINDDGTIAWPGMFPSMKEVEALHRRVGDEVSWKREYLLEIIPEDWQIIFPEWIRVYDHLPDNAVPNTIYISADLAISEKASADCTAIVVGYAYGYGNDLKVYVLDRPVNKRMGFPETLETIQKLYDEHRKICSNIKLLIEDIAYQRAAIQELIQRGYPAKGVQPTTDKRSRLMTVSGYFKMGTIILPKHGADDLHLQITGFGRDRFDDLVDATSQMLISLVFERPTMPVIGMLNMDTGKVEIMGRTTNRFSQPIESFTVEASDFIGGSQYWGPESDPSDNPKS